MANRPHTERAEDDARKPGEQEPEQPDTGSAAQPADAPEAEPRPQETGGDSSVEELVPGLGEALGESPEDEQAARVAELEAENRELKDRLLRTLAELENTRRRAERDRKDAEAYGGTRLARDLLAVYDNLSRALAAADDELREKHGAFLDGVELTQRELLNAFAKHKIRKVTPEQGEKFDPNLHEAVFEAPIPGAPNGTVIEVMQAGFTISDRLLRPAMVGVARGGEARPAETPGGAEGGPTD